MLMHPTKSGIRGIFLGLVSAIFLMNPFTVQAVEKENKPPVSRSKTTPADTAQTQLNQLDERMLKQLAKIQLAEISLGQLAKERAQSSDVKSLAKKMTDDHMKAQDELKELAKSKGVILPAAVDRQQQSVEKKLTALSGEKFDHQYMKHESTRALRDTHRLLERINSKAEDTDLKSYASKIIATVETHQQQANITLKNLRPTSEGKSGVGKSESSGSPASSGASGESGSGSGIGKPEGAYDSGVPGGASGGARPPRP